MWLVWYGYAAQRCISWNFRLRMIYDHQNYNNMVQQLPTYRFWLFFSRQVMSYLWMVKKKGAQQEVAATFLPSLRVPPNLLFLDSPYEYWTNNIAPLRSTLLGQTIDNRYEDDRFPVSGSCFTIANAYSLSSDETGVNPGRKRNISWLSGSVIFLVVMIGVFCKSESRPI